MSKQDVYAKQAAYEAAQATYDAFRADHQDVIEDHDHLAVLFIEALSAYKDALRDNANIMGKTVGSFSISTPKEYDPDELQRLLGAKATAFLKTKYTVDSRKFEEAVEKGFVPRSVSDAVVGKGTPRITGGPKPPDIYRR